MKFFPIASLAFVLATPVLLFITVLAAGGGHGSYMPAKLLFPWTMAATAFTREIAQPFIAVAIAQYPAYGIALDWARSTRAIEAGPADARRRPSRCGNVRVCDLQPLVHAVAARGG
jgi:hypothetical protein